MSQWGSARRGRGAAISFGGRILAILMVLGAALVTTAPAQARYASLVMDAETGQVLHARNANDRNYPASLTKMMTLYMTFQALERGELRLNQRLPVSRRAQGMTPSKLGLRAGSTITVENAILALVTKSANDVAVVLAEALGGTEFKFALKMTEEARRIGMSRTTFRNASGLPNRGQLSTAHDMAILARTLIDRFPQYYDYFSVESFTYKGRTYGNHNNLLGDYRGTDGIKTGYIRASGFNLVASVRRQGRRLIAVVFGGRSVRSRDRHMVALLDKGFGKLRRLETIPVVSPPPRKPRATILTAAAGGASAATEKAETETAETRPTGASAGSVHTTARAQGSANVARVSDVPLPPAAKRPSAVKLAARDLARADGAYAVQVGAFTRAKAAHRAAVMARERLPALLSATRVSITRARHSSRPIYRARLTDMSRPRADQACRLLESLERDCLVVKAVGGVEVAFSGEAQG